MAVGKQDRFIYDEGDLLVLKDPGAGEIEDQKQAQKSLAISVHSRTREPNEYERKVDLARLEERQDELEGEGKARLMEVLERMREALLGVVGKRLEAGDLTPTWVRNLDLKFKGELQRVAREILGEGYRLGNRESRRMLREKRLQVRLVPGLPPEKALAFFEQKAFYITGVLKDRLLNGARNVLYNGIKNGTPSTDVIRELKELFDEYLGDPTAIAPGKEEQAQPYRLETILRTNVNEAYNEGLKDGVDEEVDSGFVIGFLYSAIIDGRQTPVCEFLDGKILRPDTEDTNALTPSNHFNCRSILIPVTKDEGPVTFITAGQIGRALELKQKGF
jgi:SPP1 gp7 family putative phage head morphogenesis protein